MVTASTAPPFTDLTACVEALGRACDARAASSPRPDAVELSGGIDSMIVAAAASRSGARPMALTVTTDPDDSAQDAPAARRVADALGLEWRPVLITRARARELASFAVELLGGRGLYQVAATMATLALADELAALHGRVVWTGYGADRLFGPYGVPGGTGKDALDWAGRVAAQRHGEASLATSQYGDAHQRALGGRVDAHDFFVDRGIVGVAARSGGLLMAGGGLSKAPLRALGESWGLDRVLTRRPKSALQISSGIFALLADLAREDEAELTNDHTFDPVARTGRDLEVLGAYWLALRYRAADEGR